MLERTSCSIINYTSLIRETFEVELRAHDPLFIGPSYQKTLSFCFSENIGLNIVPKI